jgi:hypothetical protein
MSDESQRLFDALLYTCDDRMLGRDEGAADCLDACRDLYAYFVAAISLAADDTPAQHEHRIAVAKEQLDITIRVHDIALRRVMAEEATDEGR